MDKLAKSQAAVEALQKRLGEQETALQKATERLSALRLKWADLAEGTNNAKALTANERAQSKCESDLKRANGRIEGLRKRIPEATDDVGLAQHQANVMRLKGLQSQSEHLYGDYRKEAVKLMALAGELSNLEGEINGLKSQTDAYSRENGLPSAEANPRSPFDLGIGMVRRYGTDEGLRRFLAMLRRDEGVLGWQD